MFRFAQSMNVLFVYFVQFLQLIDFRLQLRHPILKHFDIHSGSVFRPFFLFFIDDVFLLSPVLLLRVVAALTPVPSFNDRGIDI